MTCSCGGIVECGPRGADVSVDPVTLEIQPLLPPGALPEATCAADGAWEAAADPWALDGQTERTASEMFWGAEEVRASIFAEIRAWLEEELAGIGRCGGGGGVPVSRTIQTTAPLTGGGDLSADRTLAISDFGPSGATHARGAVPDPGAGAGTAKFLREDATWAVPTGGASEAAANTKMRAAFF